MCASDDFTLLSGEEDRLGPNCDQRAVTVLSCSAMTGMLPETVNKGNLQEFAVQHALRFAQTC